MLKKVILILSKLIIKIKILIKHTMYGDCIDHPRFLPEDASVVAKILQLIV